nr:DUF1801 domain-containing protein [Vagococcus fluvialis]
MKQENDIESVERYIESFEPSIQEILRKIRHTIETVAPEATEKISYNMPTYYLGGTLVHFGAFKNHVGFYPTPSAIIHFSEELNEYPTSKGAIQFPYIKPIPYSLIADIVEYRIQENISK